MASSICTRCVLRLQRVTAPSSTTRAISTTTARRKQLPSFNETSNPELDDILASFRSKHFIPRMASKPQRKLIFEMKSKQYLEENPQTATFGDEEVPLEWIDQRTEIPNRVKLLRRALRLMREGEPKDWNNLPGLLAGLHTTKTTPTPRQLAKIVRLASGAGKFGTVLQCLHQADKTGTTMKHEEVLNAVVWAVRELGRGRDGGWEKESLEKAIKDANEIGRQLEDAQHGTGGRLVPNDPRARPELLAVFLELNAAYVYKFQGGKDEDKKVLVFTERLLANIKGAEKPETTEPAPTGPQTEVLRGTSIWHGLQLAQKVLGDRMPQPELAQRVLADWKLGLDLLVGDINAGEVKDGTYAAQAVDVWRDCIRD